MKRADLIAAAAFASCVVFVSVKVATAPPPNALRAASVEERQEVARIIAASEPSWSTESAKKFPGDSWSQSDDVHGREQLKAKELAGQRGISVEDVLRGVDEDVHRAYPAPGRRAHAVSCKPRPFYD